MAEHFAAREPVSEGKAAMVGGLVTGALAGLKADIATGGLTLGGGMLAGSLIGALGAMGVARGVNIVRGVEQPTLAWSEAVLDELFRSALVGYLAVAHFGRGRGNWAPSEHPPFWQDEAGHELQACGQALQAIWERRARRTRRRRRRRIGPCPDALTPVAGAQQRGDAGADLSGRADRAASTARFLTGMVPYSG